MRSSSSLRLFSKKVFLKEETGGALKRVIYVNRLDIKDGKMSDVIVQEFEKGQLSRLVSAEKGEWIDGSWWLEEGKVFEITKDKDNVYSSPLTNRRSS